MIVNVIFSVLPVEAAALVVVPAADVVDVVELLPPHPLNSKLAVAIALAAIA
ncbi:MAG TPA: hypothetical protein PKH97_07545 [Tetrasphaera sp.]|uniref:hypothetical protein n=1 Tax=Nostocoides sp. TaxID=1917966 RepID=UPI002CE673AE|nr:hypothetical protein [Tetrasphaera sp.]HNQ07023.1 hypothetical protein [Tetrasphaera sp.]